MSTQQDIYAAGSKSRPPILNKENYVPWSSRLLRYAKSKPNGKLIHNSIINGPYVRRMIPEPEADNQAIQTILLSLLEDIYAAVDSCETAQEIWLRVQQMMKGSDIGIQEKKAKFFNEWERFTSNVGESIESYYHRFLKLMIDLKRNKHFPERIASNLKFLNNLQPEWSRHKEVDELKDERLSKTQDPLALMATSNNPYNFLVLHQDQPSFNQNYMQQPMPNPKDITDPTIAMNMALALMAKAFKLNYSTPTNNNQGISSNPRNRQIAQPGMNMGQDRQMQMVGGNGENQFRQVQNVGNQNGLIGVPENANKNGNGNLVAARAEGNAAGHNGNQIRCYNCRDLDEIEEVNANCILMANLQQASTSGTQTDKAPVYDSDGSAEYTELLEPIPEPHQEPQNNNNVISEDSSVEQSGGTVEQHPVNVEETRVLYDSLYQSLAIEVEKVNTEKSTISFLLEEKKKLKSDFKTREDELLEKQIQLEKKIKGLNNILVKMGQSIQTIYMLSPKPDSFYHTEQKMALGYQNPFYLKQAQKKQHSLYDGKVLLEKHDHPVVHDLEETLQLAQETKFVGDFKSLAKEADESLAKHKELELEIEHLLRAVVSQDIMSIMPKASVVDTSNLQTELERTKERFENCIIKKENEYAKLWNDWYKKCKECKFDKISYDKAYKDMKQKIERLQAQLGDLKGKKSMCLTTLEQALGQSRSLFQPPVFTKKDVNSDSNGLSSTRVDNTKTRMPHPRSNTNNDRVPSASKSSQSKNKEVEVEEL
nr:hypothetical protein [Tanacetum cinerariifolium]